jgi:hypothetical protein
MAHPPGPSNQIGRAVHRAAKLSAWEETKHRGLRHNLEKELMAGIAMCDKCIEDEKRIAHYQELARTIPDLKALDAINDLIMELRTAKAERHPARED